MVFEVTSLSKKLSEEILGKCFSFTLKNSYGNTIATKGIRISTLEELMNFKKLSGCDITLSLSSIDNETPSIIIHDI